MATLANKENNVFRMPQAPKTPGKSTKSVMFKTPSRRVQDENAFKGIHTGKNVLASAKSHGKQLPFTPIGPGRMILGGKTNVYKTPGTTNTKGKQFQTVQKENGLNLQTPKTTVLADQAAPVSKSPEFDKYDQEVEFIPDRVEPLPFVPLDHIEINYEQLGKACRGRGNGINTDDSLDRPLSELIDQLPSIDHLDNLDFLDTSPLQVRRSPRIAKKQAAATPQGNSKHLSARTPTLRKDTKFRRPLRETKADVKRRTQQASNKPSSRAGGFMAPTISASAKVKPNFQATTTIKMTSPFRTNALKMVPQSPCNEYDDENKADLSSLETDIEELEKSLFL